MQSIKEKEQERLVDQFNRFCGVIGQGTHSKGLIVSYAKNIGLNRVMAQNGQLKCPKYREKTGINQFDLKMGLLKLGDPCDSRALRQIETALGKDSLGARTDGGQDQAEGKSRAGGAPKRAPDGTEVIELHMKNQVEDDLEHPTIDQYPTAMLDTNSRKSHSSHPCDSDAEQLFRDLNLDPQVQKLVQEESRNSQRKLSGERGYSTNRP